MITSDCVQAINVARVTSFQGIETLRGIPMGDQRLAATPAD
jgi:hypothetical protein